MITLREKGLPEAIEAHGNSFEIETDFRYWITFPERCKNASEGDLEPLMAMFKEDPIYISQDMLDAMVLFFDEPREIPRDSGKSGEKVLDYDLDAPYIYAGFLQAYGIDLTKDDLHWHAFRALLDSLPEECTITKIMQWRSYNGNSKTPGNEDYMRLKYMWELPAEYTEEEQAEIEEFNRLFG